MKKFFVSYTIAFVMGSALSPLPSFAAQDRVVPSQIVMDGPIPFILDNQGDVWGFKYPTELKQPVKLPHLHHVKKLAPYIALTDDGQVYTWHLGKQSKWADEAHLTAYYTKPKKVTALANVTDIAASGGYFMAAVDNASIYEWFVRSNNLGSLNTTEPHLTYTHNGIKAIATSDGSNIALLEGSTIVGWGRNNNTQLGTDRATQISAADPEYLSAPEPITTVYMTPTHTVALGSTGHSYLWGACWRNSNAKAELIKEAISSLDDIADIAVARSTDNTVPNAFRKTDGSVWLEYAPPSKTDECRTKHKRYNYYAPSYKLTGMSVPAVAIANGGYGVTRFTTLALGADNTLWGANTLHPQKGFEMIHLDLNQ